MRNWWYTSQVVYGSLLCGKWKASVLWDTCFDLILRVFPALDSRSFQNASVLAYKYTYMCMFIENLVLFLCKLLSWLQVSSDHHACDFYPNRQTLLFFFFLFFLGLSSLTARYTAGTKTHKRDSWVRLWNKKCSFQNGWCRWPKVRTETVVRMFRQCHINTLPCFLKWIWPSAYGGSANKSPYRIPEHFWNNSQQPGFQQRLNHSLLK